MRQLGAQADSAALGAIWICSALSEWNSFVRNGLTLPSEMLNQDLGTRKTMSMI